MATRQIGPNLAPRRPGAAGRVGATVFFLFWLVIPSLMLAFIARQAWRDGRTWLWDQADCTVLESGVVEVGSDPDYALSVKYAYAAGPISAVEAAQRTGTAYAPGYKGDGDYAEAQRLALKYAPGTRTVCYVNPANPDDAVLVRGGLWVLAMLPIPLLFLAVGVGGMWYTWRPHRPKPAAERPISSNPEGATTRGQFWFLVIFFSVFLIVGVAVSGAMAGNVAKGFASRGWDAVPATVVSSKVRTHSGDGTTYSINILYAYDVGGRAYRSNRYHFMGGSSSGYEGKREVVDRYPPGTRFTAYVNPADPTEAVIRRGMTWGMLLLLAPLLFAVVGAGGIYFTVRHGRRSGGAAPGALSGTASGTAWPRHQGPPPARFVPVTRRPASARPSVTLKPAQSPAVKLAAISVIALFWNGIVSVFLYNVVTRWSSGRGDVCLSIFLVPFVAVGAGLIVGAFYSLLAVFNPRCTLTLGRGDLALGESVDFSWAFAGRYDRIHRLVLRVEGREEATYRRGTSTYTDKNVFYAHDVVDTSRAADFGGGTARWAAPADSMHSLTAGNNKIVWTLTVHGHIAGWPDVKEEFPLTVGPLRRPVSPPAAEDAHGDDDSEATDDAADTEA